MTECVVVVGVQNTEGVCLCVCVCVCVSVCLSVCSRNNAKTTGPVSMKLSKIDP